MNQSFLEDNGSLNDDWDAKDYLWHPYKMTAVKISRNGSRSKRHGGARQRRQNTCQVENCGNSLKDLKEYHNRYRICEMHMRKESIERNGTLERFCQQCGRFHELHEFDGAKRSCRVRLARHNLRRRKNSTELRRLGSAGSSTLCHSNSPTVSKFDADAEESLTENEADPTAVASSLFSSQEQASLYPTQPRSAYGKESQTFLNDAFYPPSLPLKPDFEADQFVTGDNFRSFVGIDDPTDVLEGVIQYPCSGLHIAQEMPSSAYDKGVPLTMPFENNIFSGTLLMDPVTLVLPSSKIPTSIPLLNNVQVGACPPFFHWNHCAYAAAMRMKSEDSESLALTGMLGERESTEEMRTSHYKSLLKLTSLSVKVFDCIPGNLPPVLRKELLLAVRGGMVSEGYMRPGCVNLTFDSFQPEGKAIPTVDNAVATLLSSKCTFWKKHDMLVQMGNASRWILAGKVTSSFSLDANRKLYPAVKSVRPVCILTTASNRQFTVRGDNLDPIQDIEVHSRVEGQFIQTLVDTSQAGGPSSLPFFINQELRCGTLKIEVSKDGMIDRTLPVLCVDDISVVAEIESFQVRSECDLNDLLFELGLAFELRSWLHEMHVKDWFDTGDSRALFQPRMSSLQGRLRFRNASPDEFLSCLLSACELFTYCAQQGLKCTAEYLQPVVLFAGQPKINTKIIKVGGIKRQRQWKPVERSTKRVITKERVDNNTVTCY